MKVNWCARAEVTQVLFAKIKMLVRERERGTEKEQKVE